MPARSGRPTLYKGIAMRSRLEGSCARWLDNHEVKWEYEPVAFAGDDGDWLPDFRLDTIVAGDGAPLPLYIDVKPNDYDEEDLRRRMAMVWTSEPAAALAIWSTRHFWASGRGRFPLALTGAWGTGEVLVCGECARVAVIPEGASPACPYCGVGPEVASWCSPVPLPLTDWERAGEGDRAAVSLFDLDAEDHLLASLLVRPELLAEVLGTCGPRDFYANANAVVFEALAAAAFPDKVDRVVLGDELRRAGTLSASGGLSRLGDLAAFPVNPGHAGRYAAIVGDLASRRRLAAAAHEIADLAGTAESADEALGRADAIIRALNDRDGQEKGKDEGLLREGMARLLDDMERRFEDRGQAGVPTGYLDLDQVLGGGLQRGRLYVVGARPSVGKSAFALGAALNVVLEARQPVLFVSLEMPQADLVTRVMAMQGRVDASRLTSGRLLESDWPKISHALGALADAPLRILDDVGLDLARIRGAARRMQGRGGLGLIVVDYLQLMQGRRTAENRQVEVAELSRGLKILARDLDVPVMALSQLSRNLEQRIDKRPLLADLKESGSIEADADAVILLYRDELYHRDSPDRGVAEVIVAKNRQGPVRTVVLAFLDHYTRFANMARIPPTTTTSSSTSTP